jgi:hypothetical protein
MTDDRRLAVSELAALVFLTALLTFYFLPANWTSIWMDPDFAGWVGPLANRLARGQLLYADGAHLPLPPLAHVLMRVLFHGRAVWRDENLLFLLFRAAELLVLYLAFARALPRPWPFLAAAATIPYLYAPAKMVLCDAAAQFFAAAACAACLWRFSPPTPEIGPPAPRWPTRAPLLPAALVAAAFAAKQNTGAGAALGVAAFFLLWPFAEPFATRLQRTAIFAATAAGAFAALLLAFSPFISVAGFFRDVVWHGSEPKGGPALLMCRLGGFLWETAKCLTPVALGMALALGTRRAAGPEPPSADGAPADDSPRRWLFFAAGAAGPLAFLVWQRVGQEPPAAARHVLATANWLFTYAAFAVATAAAALLWHPEARRRPALAFVGLACVLTLPAALLHNLSVAYFHWDLDDNPFIAVALLAGFLPLGLSAAGGPRTRRLGAAVAAALILLAQTACWFHLDDTWKLAARCTEAWPEIAHLAGARQRPEAEGLRVLTAAVRVAALNPDDEALLLPDDPNVAAWFERPRPPLTSAIVFADQYWDRFVDEDFRRLAARPPKVIVIGPRNGWRAFGGHWHANWGVERLIDRVALELLPARYQPAGAVKILFITGAPPDFMDLWVRQDAP